MKPTASVGSVLAACISAQLPWSAGTLLPQSARERDKQQSLAVRGGKKLFSEDSGKSIAQGLGCQPILKAYPLLEVAFC